MPTVLHFRQHNKPSRAKLTVHDVREIRAWWASLPAGITKTAFAQMVAACWTRAGCPISYKTVLDVIDYGSWSLA